ncbi:hypothetical protein [Nonomuraea polychroma]|uniref:hypothetical protein n=1 Tax=Nonomuraea polychroma TaxID=46176 RepID=UPI0013E3405B|nr:hypothetical protein [Nonomuraea polychroma]
MSVRHGAKAALRRFLVGLAGPALNWPAVAPLLTRECRLLVLDLAGYGLACTQYAAN